MNEKQILEEEDSEKLMSYLRNAKYDNQVLMKVSILSSIASKSNTKTAFIDFGNLPVNKIRELRNRQKYHAIRQMEDAKKKKIVQAILDEKLPIQCFTLFLFPHHSLVSRSELEDIYDKVKSTLSLSTDPNLMIDMDQCQQLFLHFCKNQTTWWQENSVLQNLFNVCTFVFDFYSQIMNQNADAKVDLSHFVVILNTIIKGNLSERFKCKFSPYLTI